ncbi:hypothetical protein SAMN04487771_10037 [[Clostridium] aminophilum]|uniref:Biopolymer transport protein ExbD/TolR n=1 Tax=[Clostridium] aminophilum TaxID=1526 RepID=A0A1I0AWN3_9FIRM|nr:hypothetical protein [[Clostridium] aminophilum]SES98896.1 hypothetical protein SAMN04487771_10037 [[Clostridium] aminophilum]
MKRDVILDFTSLLDVTLIIIFFFVLFSTLDAQNDKEKVRNAVNEANAAKVEAEEITEQMKKSIELISSTNEKENKKGIIDFKNGDNIKLIVDIGEEKDSDGHNKWDVRLLRSDTVVGKLSGDDDFEKQLQESMKHSGYEKNDTILCDVILNMDMSGSNRAYRRIEKGLNQLQSTFPHLYFSVTDVSLGA